MADDTERQRTDMETTANPINLPPLKPTDGGGDWEVPEEGVHAIVIADFGLNAPRPYVYQGQVKEGSYQIRLTFKVVGGPSDGVEWKQWIGYSLGPRSRLTELLVAIRGGTPIPKENPDGSEHVVKLEKYLNKPFKGMIAIDEKPRRDDPSRTVKFANIVSIKPMNGAAPAAAKPAPEPEPEPEPAPAAPAEDDDPFL